MSPDGMNSIVWAGVVCQGSPSSRELSDLHVVHINGKYLGGALSPSGASLHYSFIHSFIQIFLDLQVPILFGEPRPRLSWSWMLSLPRCPDTQQRVSRKGGCSGGDTNDGRLAYDAVPEM